MEIGKKYKSGLPNLNLFNIYQNTIACKFCSLTTPLQFCPPPMGEHGKLQNYQRRGEPCDVGEEISSKDGDARVGVSLRALGKKY